jgi:hypothetical protein
MPESIEVVKSYCEGILLYLNGEEGLPPQLPESVFVDIRDSCLIPANIEKSKELSKLKDLVDDAKAALEIEVRTSREGSGGDKLITDYLLLKDLYRLYQYLHASDVEKINHARALALKGIPKILKTMNKEFSVKQRSLKKQEIAVKIILFLTIASTIFALIFAAMFREYGNILIPIVFINVFFLLWFENIWLNNISDKLEEAKAKSDPVIANQALVFLKKKNSIANLKALLEEPSVETEYQQNYLNMLVELSNACKWIESDYIEAKKIALQEVLEDSNFFTPTTFDPTFLKEWKKDLENLQTELRGLFGNNLDHFFKMTNKNPVFFVDCFRTFILSETAKKVRNFLKMI